MKYSVLDTETTTSNFGNPFDETNRVLLIGLLDKLGTSSYDIGFSGNPFGETRKHIQERFDVSDIVVGFNTKFDIHWARQIGIEPPKAIWDCQYVEYLLSGQEIQMPSLEEVCERRGLGKKVEVDWTKPVDFETLKARVEQDCRLTEQVFLQQLEELKDKPQLKRLCWWGCQDILVTEEMEWNGLKYDLELSKKLGDEMVETVRLLDIRLCDLCGSSVLNFDSHEQLSAVLYGGEAKYKERGIVTKRLKSGKEVSRETTLHKSIVFPRLVEPLKGTKLKKLTGDYWKTDEKTLRSLKAFAKAKEIIEIFLERAKWQKKIGTYFHGIPLLYSEMNWSGEILHGQLIHCRAKTTRLSSKNPNQQNLDEEVRKCIVTRFPKKLMSSKLPTLPIVSETAPSTTPSAN
jgi:DNA polymerase I-like protein with 3'-5' exonuclease and polymerase domains